MNLPPFFPPHAARVTNQGVAMPEPAVQSYEITHGPLHLCPTCVSTNHVEIPDSIPDPISGYSG